MPDRPTPLSTGQKSGAPVEQLATPSADPYTVGTVMSNVHGRRYVPIYTKPARTRIACSGRAREVLDRIDEHIDSRGQDITYPFPLTEDFMAYLKLPDDGLYRAEADRLKMFIDSLVTESDRV